MPAQVIQALLMEQITVTPSVQGNLYLRCAFVKQDCGMKQNPKPSFSSLYLLIQLHARTGSTVPIKLQWQCLDRIPEIMQQS